VTGRRSNQAELHPLKSDEAKIMLSPQLKFSLMMIYILNIFKCLL